MKLDKIVPFIFKWMEANLNHNVFRFNFIYESYKTGCFFSEYTRWFKYDRDCLCVNLATSVPVIFEPPCTLWDTFTVKVEEKHLTSVIFRKKKVGFWNHIAKILKS